MFSCVPLILRPVPTHPCSVSLVPSGQASMKLSTLLSSGISCIQVVPTSEPRARHRSAAVRKYRTNQREVQGLVLLSAPPSALSPGADPSPLPLPVAPRMPPFWPRPLRSRCPMALRWRGYHLKYKHHKRGQETGWDVTGRDKTRQDGTG